MCKPYVVRLMDGQSKGEIPHGTSNGLNIFIILNDSFTVYNENS